MRTSPSQAEDQMYNDQDVFVSQIKIEIKCTTSPNPVWIPATALTSNGFHLFMPTPIWVLLDFLESLFHQLSNASGPMSKFILNQ